MNGQVCPIAKMEKLLILDDQVFLVDRDDVVTV
jgi:hypothetical protein